MANWAKRMSAFGPVDLGNRVGHIQNNAQAHRAVVYNKAALVLDMVHRVIGADAFRRASIRLQSEHRFGPVDTETVRAAFEAEGAVDLKSLWDVFVRNTALPTMHLETSAAGPEIVVVGYSGPLPVTARIGDQRLDLVIRSRLAIPGVGAGAKIELDPDEISLVSVER